ncbi:DNA cytosine methyltransferase [Dehalococcoidia bacterium]|nr:DNA cytosine methyltransferase [Dehalococcoidia bacterium]
MPKTAIDLFAGAGGLSAGFLKTGFEVVLGLDNWRPAKVTFESNHPGSTFLLKDASDVTGDEILRAAGIAQVDVLLGGPPCQGFSTAGKRALDDPRNALVRQFLRLAGELEPKFVVMENVEGFVSFVGGRLFDEVVEAMAGMGYESWQRVLQAADYGVPQKRKRFFLVATRLPVDYSFPQPTHRGPNNAKLVSTHLPPWLTFWDAVSDLPLIRAGESASEYASPPKNDYQGARRNGSDVLHEHIAPHHTEKLMKLMSFVPPGKSVFDVWDEIPEVLRPTSGFANSYGRIVANEPAPTITRNFTTPSSAQCVHPRVDRALSLREGARVQSFDDTFRFLASFTDNRLLIGNAVPPLLAKAVADSVKDALDKYEDGDLETKEAVFRRRSTEMGEKQLPLFPVETG